MSELFERLFEFLKKEGCLPEGVQIEDVASVSVSADRESGGAVVEFIQKPKPKGPQFLKRGG